MKTLAGNLQGVSSLNSEEGKKDQKLGMLSLGRNVFQVIKIQNGAVEMVGGEPRSLPSAPRLLLGFNPGHVI